MRLIVLTLLFSAFAFQATSQKISREDLSKINGRWLGYLVYTDYSDDQKQVRLDTNLTADWKNNSGSLVFEYTEPNGKIVKGKQKIKLGKSEGAFFMDGDWSVVDFEKADAMWKLTLEKTGKDNNRNATIRQELQVSDATLTIEKLVKYKDTDQFFTRNKYDFKK